MTHVTCRLTAKNRHQLLNSALSNRVWATFTFIRYSTELIVSQADRAHHVGGGQAYFWSGGEARERGGILREGAPQAGGSGEHCKLPQRGPDRASLKGFLAFQRLQMASPGSCWGPSSRGWGMPPPLYPPVHRISCGLLLQMFVCVSPSEMSESNRGPASQ